VGTDLIVKALHIGINQGTLAMVHCIDETPQIQFDATALAQGLARRASGRPLDATRANLLADFGQILN
jgi:hypothetical protein